MEVAEVVRKQHPVLGPRQAEVLSLLARAGDRWSDTGELAAEMKYERANVYLTLQGLMELGFVEKDASRRPHVYRLADRFRPSS
jgi:DNA-binding IclR family transcriptional regulator